MAKSHQRKKQVRQSDGGSSGGSMFPALAIYADFKDAPPSEALQIFGDWLLGLGKFSALRETRIAQGFPRYPSSRMLFDDFKEINDGMALRLTVAPDPHGRGAFVEWVAPASSHDHAITGHLDRRGPEYLGLKGLGREDSLYPILWNNRVMIAPSAGSYGGGDRTGTTVVYAASIMSPGADMVPSTWRPTMEIPGFVKELVSQFGKPTSPQSISISILKQMLLLGAYAQVAKLLVEFVGQDRWMARTPFVIARGGSWLNKEILFQRAELSDITSKPMLVLGSMLDDLPPVAEVSEEGWAVLAEQLPRAIQGLGRIDDASLLLLGPGAAKGEPPVAKKWFINERTLSAMALSRIAGEITLAAGQAAVPEVWGVLDAARFKSEGREAINRELADQASRIPSLQQRIEDQEERIQKQDRALEALAGDLKAKEGLLTTYLARADEERREKQAAQKALAGALEEHRRAIEASDAKVRHLQGVVESLSKGTTSTGVEDDLLAKVREAESLLAVAEQERQASVEEARKAQAAYEQIRSQMDEVLARPIARMTPGGPDSERLHLAVLSGAPAPESALLYLAEAFPRRVVVLESAVRSARRSEGFVYKEKAFDLMKRLVIDYYEAMAEGGGDARAREIFGREEYASSESETVLGNPRAQDLRTFPYKGRLVVMNRHLKIGTKPSAAETMRIHFHWDSEDQKIVIGWAGPHLDHA